MTDKPLDIERVTVPFVAVDPQPTIWYGKREPAVEILQNALASHHVYDPNHGDAPGHFGPVTEQALRGFQESQGLQVDAVCGPATWTALGFGQPDN